MKRLDLPQAKQEILHRLRTLRPDSPRLWGMMTCAQMICHLSDSFRGIMGEKPSPLLPGYFARKFIKWYALRLPLRWPKGVPTRPEFDQRIGGTKPTDFSKDLEELLILIEKFLTYSRHSRFQPHPIFLEMTEEEWMRWAYLHLDHHLRQFGA